MIHNQLLLHIASFTDSDSVYINSGTWSVISVVTENPVINNLSYRYGFSNEGRAYSTNDLLKI